MAIAADTLIPTANGWVKAADLVESDMVFDHLGRPTKIKTIQHFLSKDCYEVEFEDGLTVTGDKNLTLPCQDIIWRDHLSAYKSRKAIKKRRPFSRPLVPIQPTEDLPLMRGPKKIYSVPNCMPVQYPYKDLPVPPYIFAVWFATMTSTGRHWLRERPLNKMQIIFRGYGHTIKTRKHKNGLTLFDIRPSIRDSFLFAGASIPTNIPFSYIDGSVEQRIELFHGFFDAGLIKNYKRSNLYVAKEANYGLIRKIQALVESLGLKTVLHTPSNSSSYTLKFRMNGNFDELYGTHRRFIVKITKIAPKQCIHIETGTNFLVGEGYIPVC